MVPKRLKNQLKDWWSDQLNEDIAEELINVVDIKPQRTLRRNPLKSWSHDSNVSTQYSDLPYSFAIKSSWRTSTDPDWHAGCYYIQDASSLYLDNLWKELNTKKPIHWALDMCAAPGGKTLGLIQSLPSAVLVANEVSKSRASILQENINRFGLSQSSIITRNHPKDIQSHIPFDLILVDAPCSGEGLFAREEKAWQQWNPTLVRQCATRQQAILERAWANLDEGGYLVYTTCTLNTIENEGVLGAFLKDKQYTFTESEALSAWYQKEGSSCYRSLPSQQPGSGLTVTIIQKQDKFLEPEITRQKDIYWHLKKELTPIVKNICKHQGLPIFHSTGDAWYSLQPHSCDIKDIQYFLQTHYPLQAGTVLGSQNKDSVIDTDSVFSSELEIDIPTLKLDQLEAQQYIKGEVIKVDNLKPGLYCATFNGNRLGLLKVLEDRVQNMYPKAYRRYAR